MPIKRKKFKKGLDGYVYSYDPIVELEEETGLVLPPVIIIWPKDPSSPQEKEKGKRS